MKFDGLFIQHSIHTFYGKPKMTPVNDYWNLYLRPSWDVTSTRFSNEYSLFFSQQRLWQQTSILPGIINISIRSIKQLFSHSLWHLELFCCPPSHLSMKKNMSMPKIFAKCLKYATTEREYFVHIWR